MHMYDLAIIKASNRDYTSNKRAQYIQYIRLKIFVSNKADPETKATAFAGSTFKASLPGALSLIAIMPVILGHWDT